MGRYTKIKMAEINEVTHKLTWEEWEEKFEPILEDEGSDYRRFETFPPDLDEVLSADPKCVWTVLEGDDGSEYICPGYHLVNRMYYLITKKPCLDPNMEDILYWENEDEFGDEEPGEHHITIDFDGEILPELCEKIEDRIQKALSEIKGVSGKIHSNITCNDMNFPREEE